MGCKFPEMHPTQIQNAPRGVDSSISESIPKKSRYPSGYLDFLMLERDSKGGSENSPVDCFPAVGESLSF